MRGEGGAGESGQGRGWGKRIRPGVSWSIELGKERGEIRGSTKYSTALSLGIRGSDEWD